MRRSLLSVILFSISLLPAIANAAYINVYSDSTVGFGDGMTDQINALSNMGLLNHFLGMTTDSRSFLSYPRHDYFRRLLCRILGNDMEEGLIPNDPAWVGEMVVNISYRNAATFFDFGLMKSESNQNA